MMGAATRVSLVVASLLTAWPAAQVREREFTPLLSFSVTDAQETYSVRVSRDLTIVARRAVDAKGLHMGWDFAATDRRLEPGPNFFYDCLCGHGPRPNDLYAWHFVSNYYPADRRLPVYGYPFEVRVRCIDCRADGSDGSNAIFVHGMVEVGVRRLAESNPRQRRISDLKEIRAAGS